MTRFFLDTHEWSYLLDPPPRYASVDIERARERLLARSREANFSVMGSVSLLQEFLPLKRKNPDLYERIISLVFQVVGKNWLRPLNEMHVAEAMHGGMLTGRAPFLGGAIRSKLRALADSDADVAAVAADTEKLLRAFEDDQARTKASVLGKFEELNDGEPVDTKPLLRDWWDGLDIADWVQDVVDGGVERGVLSADTVQEISASTVPSAWHFTSFKLARILRNIGEGEKVQASDLIDAEHYIASIYCDVLVTDDKKFTHTAKLLTDRPFEIEKLDQFLDRLL